MLSKEAQTLKPLAVVVHRDGYPDSVHWLQDPRMGFCDQFAANTSMNAEPVDYETAKQLEAELTECVT